MAEVVTDPWSLVIGQDAAVTELKGWLPAPSHAYLFLAPSGAGAQIAARVFAGLLLAERAEDPDRALQLAIDGVHPDISMVKREGPFISIEQARAVAKEAAQAPVESDRKAFILDEFHLLDVAAPAFLKTIEEPPPGRFFIVIAEDIPPELVTISSRCITIEFRPVPAAAVASTLVAEGHSASEAEFAAMACSGDLDRARVLVNDPDLRSRYDLWRSVPERLDGTGAVAGQVAEDLAAAIGEVLAPLEERHKADLIAYEEEAELFNLKAAAKKKLIDGHKRELRRYRSGEWRFGYGVLSSRYRDELATAAKPRPLLLALKLLADTGDALDRNTNERLLLDSLLMRLPPLR